VISLHRLQKSTVSCSSITACEIHISTSAGFNMQNANTKAESQIWLVLQHLSLLSLLVKMFFLELDRFKTTDSLNLRQFVRLERFDSYPHNASCT
jgi:hypothetical protein